MQANIELLSDELKAPKYSSYFICKFIIIIIIIIVVVVVVCGFLVGGLIVCSSRACT